jgi:hypothetical protein
VYAYLLPTDNVPSDYTNLRLVCRKVKNEFDEEIVRDITKLFDSIARSCVVDETPRYAILGTPTSFHDTRMLRVFFPSPRNYTVQSLHELLSQFIPHIRELKVQFDNEDDTDYITGGYHGRDVAYSTGGSMTISSFCFVVSEYFRNHTVPMCAQDDLDGVRKVTLDWEGIGTMDSERAHWLLGTGRRNVRWNCNGHPYHVAVHLCPVSRKKKDDYIGMVWEIKTRSVKKRFRTRLRCMLGFGRTH